MCAIENSKITSIIIDCELFMYGTITLSIDKSEEGIMTYWLGASDGGMYVEKGKQEYDGKSFEEILNRLLSVQYPEEEGDEEYFNWSIRIANEDEEHFLLEIGQWGRDLFESILAIIDGYLVDRKFTEMFHNML